MRDYLAELILELVIRQRNEFGTLLVIVGLFRLLAHAAPVGYASHIWLGGPGGSGTQFQTGS